MRSNGSDMRVNVVEDLLTAPLMKEAFVASRPSHHRLVVAAAGVVVSEGGCWAAALLQAGWSGPQCDLKGEWGLQEQCAPHL